MPYLTILLRCHRCSNVSSKKSQFPWPNNTAAPRFVFPFPPPRPRGLVPSQSPRSEPQLGGPAAWCGAVAVPLRLAVPLAAAASRAETRHAAARQDEQLLAHREREEVQGPLAEERPGEDRALRQGAHVGRDRRQDGEHE